MPAKANFLELFFLGAGNTNRHFAVKFFATASVEKSEAKTLLSGVGNPRVLGEMHKHQYFWSETHQSHKGNIIIQMGRIFDKDEHAVSIHALKRWVMENKSLFTTESLKKIKSNNGIIPER